MFADPYVRRTGALLTFCRSSSNDWGPAPGRCLDSAPWSWLGKRCGCAAHQRRLVPSRPAAARSRPRVRGCRPTRPGGAACPASVGIAGAACRL